jgi:hypothetical protein
MACDLLQGLEEGNLRLIAQRLQPLRQTLAARHSNAGGAFDAAALDGGGSLRLEQLDLLEGIAENLEASLEAIQRSSRPHLRRIETAGSLLRHLVSEPAVPSAPNSFRRAPPAPPGLRPV